MSEDLSLPPSYVQFDKKQREEFLSQYGITSPSQREMFHQLCNSWRPLIDFDTFTGARTGVVTHPVHETENLVNRLRSAKMGLFTYKKNEKGERIPKDIVLCEEGDSRYWFYFVQDLIQQACENPRNPFLTATILRSREILVPTDGVEECSLAQLSKSSIDAISKNERLLFVPLQGEKVLATSQTLALLLTFSSSKLRFTLKNPEITAAISRLLNQSLSEVAKRLEDKESGFWRNLTETLLKHRDDLLADRRLHLDSGLFQAAELFFQYLTNQIEEVKRQKEQDQEREADLRQVEQAVLLDKASILSQAELDNHMKILLKDKYGDRFDALKEEFVVNYLQSPQKTALPVILTLTSGLVHRNNLYRLMIRRFDALLPLLRQDYLAKMERRLRKPHANTDIDFLNKENLERSLAEWTAKNDALVAELFAKPKMLAEAVIHHGRANQGLVSVDEMKPLLERFFRPGVMTLKPYQDIYGLDVPRYYEDSFKRLSVLTQFWRRVTGSYRIQAEQFRGLALPKEKRPESRPSLSGVKVDETPLEELSPEERKARKEEWKQRKRTESSGAKRTSEPEVVVKKHYTDGDRDKAWKGFKETLHKD